MENRLQCVILGEYVLPFYYKDDEIVAVASERPVLQTTFDLAVEDIQELEPGTAPYGEERWRMHHQNAS